MALAQIPLLLVEMAEMAEPMLRALAVAVVLPLASMEAQEAQALTDSVFLSAGKI